MEMVDVAGSPRRERNAATEAARVAAFLVATAVAATSVFGQTKPGDLKRVLSMRVSPGSIALLALHAEQPDAQQRVASAIADPDPAVRAVAARVVFARGIRAFLPAVAGTVARETDPRAAFEQTRALSLAGSEYDAVIADAVKRLQHLNPLLSSPPQIVAERFAPAPQALLFRTASDFPPDLTTSVAKATGCKVENAARTQSGGAAEVTLRADGRVAQISVIDTKLARECAEAVLALFALYTANLPRPAEEGERRLLMLPLLPDDPACRVDPAAAQPLPETTASGTIRAPQKIHDVKPIYPSAAQRDRVSGVVVLEAVLSAAGCISSARVLRGVDPRLDWAALFAVSQWRFTPTLLSGRATPIVMSVTVRFTLN